MNDERNPMTFVSGRGVLRVGIITLCLFIGCSKGPKIPQMAAVTGKVMYQDKPLAGAEVGFIPKVEGKEMLAARGVTNDSGSSRGREVARLT
jgi:hypothetical protein